ncbi:MAG: YhcH/YjgK/YiaL family protein [Planctomycetales bacterium]|nr:YhcH/YjgK/YiaL family protein [Planctomycetales bacterium]
MIIATLADAARYRALHPRFSDAFQFLNQADGAALDEGRVEIDGDDLFAIAWQGAGKGQADASLEFHRKYIDIQYVIHGFDVVGWRAIDACQRVKLPYDESTDVGFYFEQPHSWCRIPAKSLVILFPEDAHAPLATTTTLKKIVVKVKQ